MRLPSLRAKRSNPESRKRRLDCFVATLLAMTAAAPASAHPHVWITAASEVIYAADGSITGVRHAWTFDDMFSTYALQGMESKAKGVWTREELAPRRRCR